jgi:hypothetical protein
MAPGARFCTRCGFGFADPAGRAPRALAMDTARAAWGSAGTGAHGPFELPLSSDERPILWKTDDRSPVLLTSRGVRGILYRLAISPSGVRADTVISDLDYDSLRNVCVTQAGVFAIDDGGLTAARSDRGSGWILNSAILPDGASAVGIARDRAGQIGVLARQGDQLRLYGGRGMSALRLIAGAPAPSYQGWFDLALGPGGEALFWGGGMLGRLDAKSGRLVMEADSRAPEQPLSLDKRGATSSLHGAAKPSRRGAVPVAAECASGWGLLSAVDGVFVEAAADLARPLAVSGLGEDAAVLFGPTGPTLVRIDSATGPLTTIPIGGWGRDVPSAGALGVLDEAILAVVTAAGSTDGFLLRTDSAQRSLGLAGAAHFDVGRRGMTAPMPIASLPPLPLIGGVVVGMMMDQLTLWLAPWTETPT